MTSTSGLAARAATVLGVLAVLLAGCGSNDGGQTRCQDFVLMSQADREDVVRSLLIENGNADPAEPTIDLTVTAASYHCLTPGTADDPIATVLG